MKTGPLFDKLQECIKKLIVVQGGGDAAKTVTILQFLALDSILNANSLTTITGQDIPNIKKGSLRSFQKYVLPDFKAYIQDYNKTDRVYTFTDGSVMEFTSFGDEQDARGSERDNLFINEANAFTYNQFWQLQRKTRRRTILDYNPTSPFWVHDRILSGAEKQFADKHQLYIVDHRHNPFLSQEEHDSYESISDPDLFRVYSRGLTGKVKGLIFGHFKKVDRLPAKYDRIIWGLDYGYTNDPTALVKIAVVGRKRYVQECSYAPGLGAQRIKDLLIENGWESGQSIYSEADPNMIAQLRQLGLPIMPAIKGPGSIIAGISKVKEFICYYTEDSSNFEKEINTWKWMMAEDMQTGKEVMTNVPVAGNDHLCDATRYAIYTDSFYQRTG